MVRTIMMAKVIFEGGKTSLLPFMQYMEDIVNYTDEFTCGHNISLDTSSENLDMTNIEDSTPFSSQGMLLNFSITRSKKPATSMMDTVYTKAREEKVVTVTPSLSQANHNLVHQCTLRCGKEEENFIIDRTVLRDSICKSLVPALRVFPLLHFLTHQTAQMNAVPIPPEMAKEIYGEGVPPKLCMHVKGHEREVYIALDPDDQLVTWAIIPSQKKGKATSNSESMYHDVQVETRRWSLDDDGTTGDMFRPNPNSSDKNAQIYDGKTLLFLSYVMGIALTVMQP